MLMMQDKYQQKIPTPFVPLSEGAGIVLEVGAKVTAQKPGDRVVYSWHSCAAEEVTVQTNACQPMPAGLTFSQAAGFKMGFTTAYHGLADRGRLKPGEWLLVAGAGGGMGLAAVQMGKALGAKVIAADLDDKKLAICKEVGADYVVNYQTQEMRKVIADITNGYLVDVVYELVGGDIFDQVVRCVTPQGRARICVVGFVSGSIPKLPINLALVKGFDLVGVRMGHQMGLQPELMEKMLDELFKLANEGKLKTFIGAEQPFTKVKELLTLMEEKKTVGKLCLTFGADSKL
jgi:NADPH2:quinone reductase